MQKAFFLVCMITCILFMSTSAFSQLSTEDTSHSHELEHHHGDEVGVAIGIVPIPEENEIALGMHLHYIKGIGKKKIYGLGLSFETIFDEHRHYTFSIVNQFRIYKGLIASYAPGLLLIKEESGIEYQFAQHFEIAYEFNIGHFHVGPLVDLSIEKAGMHYMAGLHFGIDL
jgi:hypothetical protein